MLKFDLLNQTYNNNLSHYFLKIGFIHLLWQHKQKKQVVSFILLNVKKNGNSKHKSKAFLLDHNKISQNKTTS